MTNFSLKARIKSFAYAFAGIAHLIRSQHNAWIHLLATGVVIGLGWFFSIPVSNWVPLVLAITLVWLAEGMNTAVELLADAITEKQHPLIGHAKDVAAGAVLISAIGAVVVAALVFYPYLMV